MRTFWALLAGLMITVCSWAQTPRKVLFVGNSYTYFWNLHLQVQALSKRGEDYLLKTRATTAGGVTLAQHWRGAKGLKSRSLLNGGGFDAVILQDHSRQAIDAPDSLLHYGSRLAEAARQHGAEVYFYVTWAREWDPYMQDPILKTYREVAQQNNARIIPVGPAWERARSLRPELDLYHADGSHPSAIGTYLAACVIYGALTGESPLGLTERVALDDPEGIGYLFLNRMTPEDALFCQRVAQETLEKFDR